MAEVVDVADLDCIYLTYDEPQKDEFWAKILNMVPWAKHVDGVYGSDAAHKAAAKTSDTERFVLIDGDNMPDPEFFNLQLTIDDATKDCVFRWKGRNIINGLMYGNGGLSCWPVEFVMNMKSHENTDGRDETLVEFCFDDNYKAMHNCYSTTYPNGSELHAWRAGFREGVKMVLDQGKRPDLNTFEKAIHARNYDNLCIWQTVGRDVEHGNWAIYGARLGTFLTMLTDWDYVNVRDFKYLTEMFNAEYASKDPEQEAKLLGEILQNKLGMPICEMDAEASKFFKAHYSTHTNYGIMIQELDVIRQIEGW